MFKKNTLIVSLAVIAIFMVVMVIISSFSKNNNEVVINLDQPEKSIKNIIFIVADDLGWSDVGYGDPNSDAYTPTIDQLAREGIILDQAYAYPMCTPSRTSLMTGLFAERVGLQHFVIPNSKSLQPIGVPLDIKMFPEYLKEYGFKSHIVGKWHLGSCKMDYTPVHRGFDSFYGYFYGSQNYFTHKSLFLNGTYDDFWYQSRNYLKPIADRTRLYSTLAFNDHITEIIDSHDKTKPLFLYYAAQNPHSDRYFNVPKEFEEKFSYIKNEKRRRILAMINMLDESILNITRDLERNNLLEHTLIVFTSDNGGEISDLHRNYPLRGGKTTVFEGGQRVRSFIYGKDLDIKPFVYNGMFHFVDWLPTIMSAAMDTPINIDDIDGVNQWETILNNRPSKRNSFIYNIDPLGSRRSYKHHCSTPTEAIRVDDWKLIRGCPGLYTGWYNLTDYEPDLSLDNLDLGIELSISHENNQTCLRKNRINPKRYFLFNLKNDPYEKENLADQMPCKVRDLEKRLDEYQSMVVLPQVKEPLHLYHDPRGDPRNTNNKFWPGWC